MFVIFVKKKMSAEESQKRTATFVVVHYAEI